MLLLKVCEDCMQSGIFFELVVIFFFEEICPHFPIFFRGAIHMELAAFDLNELPDRFRAYIAMFNIYRILGHTSLEVLRDIYQATSGNPSLIHAVTPPHLNSRGSYVVELEPLGLPVSGSPLQRS